MSDLTLGAWWHRKRGHLLDIRRGLTVPVWDRFARGVLVRCSCGKVWAR